MLRRFLNRQKSACDNKIRHSSKATADLHVEELLRKRKPDPKADRKLHSYHCPHCGWWHVGHGPKKQSKPKPKPRK